MKTISKTIKIIALILLFLALAFLVLQFFLAKSQEDNWICTQGEWVKHGNPSAPMPQTECPGFEE